MHIHINHCFCTDPCWGGEPYWSRYMVSVEKVVDYRHKKVNALDSDEEEDWNDILEFKDVWDQTEYENSKKLFSEIIKEGEKNRTERIERHAEFDGMLRNVPHLKQEVIDWLNLNVKDNQKDQSKGWCMGTDTYNGSDKLSFTLWFYRRRDALKFIREWSSHTKPTTYFDYFKDIYKELIDGKLVKV